MKKRIPYIEYLPIIIASLVIFKLLDRIDSLLVLFLFLLNMFQPFFWAAGIAYIINPMMKFIEKKTKIKRIFSILICYIFVIGLIAAIIMVVIPMIAENITDLIENFDSYKNTATKYFDEVIEETYIYQQLSLEKYLTIDTVTDYFGDLPKILDSTLNGIVKTVFNVFGGVFRIVVGFVIAVYLLLDKEKFQLGFRRIIYSHFKEKKADLSMLFFEDVNKIFSRYIIGKTIDSAIIGVLCFVGLLIINAPYAALLAIIVGITNMIPYFGPFIGMVPAIFLTLFFSPVKALQVGLYILALQQFDGYFLGPKILGDSVGVSPFWIILAIIVGGSLMGILGMLLAVPVVAVMQLIFTRMIDKKLAKKDILIE